MVPSYAVDLESPLLENNDCSEIAIDSGLNLYRFLYLIKKPELSNLSFNYKECKVNECVRSGVHRG